MKPQIVITRTRPDADALAEKLETMGYAPLVEPMLRVVPTRTPSPHDPICTEALVITSAQALRHLSSAVVKGILRDKAVYAVGPRTAAIARELGWTHVHDGGGDVRMLGDFLKSRTEITPSSRLLHICGRDIARDTRDILATVPGKIWDWVVYETEAARQLTPAMKAFMRTDAPRAVLFYSARAAAAFADCVRAYEPPQTANRIIFLCLSKAVLESLPSMYGADAYTAVQPDEEALLGLLKAHLPL